MFPPGIITVYSQPTFCLHSFPLTVSLRPQKIWGGKTPWAIFCSWGHGVPLRSIAL